MTRDELSACSPLGDASLTGRTVLITGATSGAGLEAAAILAKRGARVLIAGRNAERLEAARKHVLTSAPSATVVPSLVDLSSTVDVRRFAAETLRGETRLHALVNNAGVLAPGHALSQEGRPLSVEVDYLAPFLLAFLLFPLLRVSAPSHIVHVSSLAVLLGDVDPERFLRVKEYTAFGHYCNAKLAAVISTEEMARRVAGSGVAVVSMDPGLSRSEFFRNLEQTPAVRALGAALLMVGRPVQQTARAHVFAATDSRVKSGEHYRDCRPFYSSWTARDRRLAAWLWQFTKRTLRVSAAEDWEGLHSDKSNQYDNYGVTFHKNTTLFNNL